MTFTLSFYYFCFFYDKPTFGDARFLFEHSVSIKLDRCECPQGILDEINVHFYYNVSGRDFQCKEYLN